MAEGASVGVGITVGGQRWMRIAEQSARVRFMQQPAPSTPSHGLARALARPLAALQHPAALLAATIAVSFFVALGAVPLFDPDEGAFGAATLEMLRRHDFLLPYLFGEPRYDKPILVYWLQAASVRLLGANEWAFRLPSALAATVWAWSTYRFGRERFGETAGLLAAVMLACAPSVQLVARAATADALLNACIAASMFALYRYLTRGERAQLYVAAAAAALGLLAKGPIAIVIPGAVSLLFCFLRREPGAWVRLASQWRAWLVFLAVAAPWYVVETVRNGPGFAEAFFLGHNLGRYTGASFGHDSAWWFYLPVILVGTLPFTAPVASALARWRELLRDDAGTFLLLWFVFVIVFFSFAGSQQPHYANYGYTGVFLLAAARARSMRSRAVLLPALLAFAALAALPFALETLAARLD